MPQQCETPTAGKGAAGAHGNVFAETPELNKPRRKREAFRARVLPDGEPVAVNGRVAQTLRLLIDRGPRGFTSGEASPLGWARRTSDYVHKLRRLGFPIGMEREPTPDGAVVGRYALTGRVVVLEDGAAHG